LEIDIHAYSCELTLASQKLFDTIAHMTIISIAQVIVSIIMIVLILLQNSTAGVGGAFGGADSVGGVQNTRRGAEKQLLNLTVVFAILFALLSLAALFLG